YTLDDVQVLFLDSPGEPLVDVLAALHTTAAYRAAQFQRDPITLRAAITDRGVDLDGDGRFNLLRVSVPVNVVTAGQYQYSATLAGPDGQEVAAVADTVSLTAGDNTLSLDFNGYTLRDPGFSAGPLTLAGLSLEQVSAPSRALRLAAAYTTDSYSSSQFDRVTTLTASSSDSTAGTVGILPLRSGGRYDDSLVVSVGALPASGFAFVRWTEHGTTASTSNPFSFTLSSDRSLVAEFQVAPAASVTPTATPSESPTPTPTESPGPSPSPTFTLVASPTSTVTPADTTTPTPTQTATPTPSATRTIPPTATATPSPTLEPTATATPTLAPYAPPHPLRAKALDSLDVLVTWQDVSSAETGFRIQRAERKNGVPGKYVLVANVPPNTTGYTQKLRKAPADGCYRVLGLNGTTLTAADGEVCVKTQTAPRALLPKRGAKRVSLTPQLTWRAVTGAALYELQISRIASFNLPDDITVITTGTQHTLIQALAPNTRYYWRLRTRSADPDPDLSSWSTAFNFTTVATAAPPQEGEPAPGPSSTE
ncbi:MAG: hypothetical protein IT307_19480, partial [Chloroflexi bacterium]|nr:hypothetical protein [Chloroflexota bacterium]